MRIIIQSEHFYYAIHFWIDEISVLTHGHVLYSTGIKKQNNDDG